jgi:outer membrane receptor protein involved in Fe transport
VLDRVASLLLLRRAGAASAAAASLLCAAGVRAENPSATETIVVTGTRTPVPESESSAPVEVVPGTVLRDGKAVDEALRIEPSFQVFRRSSSLVADPSSQGVNLRGIGPSGVSRALVLEDGVPLNDGFGGWVYWGSVPRLAIDRVEIAPGASSALYGSAALGGVIQLVSRPIDDRAEIEMEGGTYGTATGALSLSRKGEAISGSLDVEGLRTSGYDVVAQPGAIDHAASSWHLTGRLRLESRIADGVVASVRAGAFTEDEDGGTQFTTATVRQQLVSIGVSTASIDARAFARFSHFQQDRSRILPNAFARTSEELAAFQRAPADDEGVSLQWHAGALTAGVDLRRVFGRSIEEIHPPSSAGPTALVFRRAFGEQQQAGAFAEGLADVTRWLQLQAALRVDGWRNVGGSREEVASSGTVTATPLPDRDDAQLSSRLAVRVHPEQWLAVRAAGYRSFRAPTLNELYRPFQVGPVAVDANPQLGPETLLGVEAGIDLGTATASLRATGFVSRLENPIVNTTIGPNHQMRQNLGLARIRGVEMRALWTPTRAVHVSGGWTFVDSRVLSSDLFGRELPQDPRHRLSARIDVREWRGFGASFEVRWVSGQYDDDLNQFRLAGFAAVNATLSRALSDRWTVFAAVENLFDRQYLVGLQGGVATVGQPFFIRGGVRASLF